MGRRSHASLLLDFVAKSRLALLASDQYEEWSKKVLDIETGNKMSHSEAVIESSKEFACLGPLLTELDESGYDTNPKSKVRCEGKELPYIENVRWAVAAAGETSMTGKTPRRCPNTTAWYLDQQALEDPGKFCSLVNTAEGKAVASDGEIDLQRSCRKSIEELDRLLTSLK